jgi:hypothetical protein
MIAPREGLADAVEHDVARLDLILRDLAGEFLHPRLDPFSRRR